MRYAIISDVHANLQALEVVLDQIDSMDNIDQIVCLGDVVGYNANPNECVDIIREREIPTVCGNHDAVACGKEQPWGFNPIALNAALWTREHLSEESIAWLKDLPDMRIFDHFLAAHGSPTDRDCYLFTWEDIIPHFEFVQEHGKRLCFFGHTHCPGIFSPDGTYLVDEESKFLLNNVQRNETNDVFFINPGSVGQPRDGDSRAAFGLFDTETWEYEQVRISYPVEEAAHRILEKGLPEFLAERLSLGR